jgi:hypothetical protein
VYPLGFYFFKKFSEFLWCLRSRDHWALGPTPSPLLQLHQLTRWVSTMTHPLGQSTRWVLGVRCTSFTHWVSAPTGSLGRTRWVMDSRPSDDPMGEK